MTAHFKISKIQKFKIMATDIITENKTKPEINSTRKYWENRK
jgi:hypothetical protein